MTMVTKYTVLIIKSSRIEDFVMPAVCYDEFGQSEILTDTKEEAERQLQILQNNASKKYPVAYAIAEVTYDDSVDIDFTEQ